MPNITNVQRAFNQISEKSLSHEGDLDADTFMGFFTEAVSEFKLTEDKVGELKGFKYPVEVKGMDQAEVSIGIDNSENVKEPSEVELMMEVISKLESQVNNLTGALAKIGTLTGYGNHLKEFKIDKWIPTRKDMGKKYS